MTTLSAIVLWLRQKFEWTNEIPNNTWNRWLAGLLGPYDASQDHNILNLVFYWREVWHFIGGVIVGLITSPLMLIMPTWLATYGISLILCAVMAAKELLGDASEQANGVDFKNIVDFLVWTAGCFLLLTAVSMLT